MGEEVATNLADMGHGIGSPAGIFNLVAQPCALVNAQREINVNTALAKLLGYPDPAAAANAGVAALLALPTQARLGELLAGVRAGTGPLAAHPARGPKAARGGPIPRARATPSGSAPADRPGRFPTALLRHSGRRRHRVDPVVDEPGAGSGELDPTQGRVQLRPGVQLDRDPGASARRVR